MPDPVPLHDLTDQERRVIAKCIDIAASLLDPNDFRQRLALSGLLLKVQGHLRFETLV